MHDVLICYRSKYIHVIERHIQQCLNKLSDWADTNGFKFSSSKTVCMHFCRLHKLHKYPVLILNGSAIPVVAETKFLGITFDRKLSFLPHIRHLKDKCTKSLNLHRVVAHTTWGACRSANIDSSIQIPDQIETKLRLCCFWLCSRLLLTYLGPDAKSCTSSLPWCLSNVAIFQFICITQ